MFQPSARPVHLVKNFDEVPVAKRKYPMVAQEKHDGCYAFAIVKEGDYRIFSRTGKSEFIALKHLSDQLKERYEGSDVDFVLIFEVMAEGMSAAQIAGRSQDLTDLFPEAYAVVHDCIPFTDFEQGRCEVPYHLRWADAMERAFDLGWISSDFELVNNEVEARAFAESLIKQGKEGAVFKQPKGIWVAGKKNEVMMKIKEGLSFDLEVIGIEAGDSKGKYSHTLGNLVCKFRAFGKTDGEYTTVRCSGMTDAQRSLWHNNPALIIGQIVQVDAMKFTDYGNLREPRFKGIRLDKECPDII